MIAWALLDDVSIDSNMQRKRREKQYLRLQNDWPRWWHQTVYEKSDGCSWIVQIRVCCFRCFKINRLIPIKGRLIPRGQMFLEAKCQIKQIKFGHNHVHPLANFDWESQLEKKKLHTQSWLIIFVVLVFFFGFLTKILSFENIILNLCVFFRLNEHTAISNIRYH